MFPHDSTRNRVKRNKQFCKCLVLLIKGVLYNKKCLNRGPTSLRLLLLFGLRLRMYFLTVSYQTISMSI
jgi:hypothetical protein